MIKLKSKYKNGFARFPKLAFCSAPIGGDPVWMKRSHSGGRKPETPMRSPKPRIVRKSGSRGAGELPFSGGGVEWGSNAIWCFFKICINARPNNVPPPILNLAKKGPVKKGTLFEKYFLLSTVLHSVRGGGKIAKLELLRGVHDLRGGNLFGRLLGALPNSSCLPPHTRWG